MIDTTLEKLVAFAKAPALLPDRPHLSTLHRWRLKGVKGVKLETVLVGGRRYTSAAAVDRFIQRTTAAADGEPVELTAPLNDRRARELDQVDGELAKAGI